METQCDSANRKAPLCINKTNQYTVLTIRTLIKLVVIDILILVQRVHVLFCLPQNRDVIYEETRYMYISTVLVYQAALA